jgi:CubicO group peptidase (beta-lactamase class C family)
MHQRRLEVQGVLRRYATIGATLLTAACASQEQTLDPATPPGTPATDDGSGYWPGETWRTAAPEQLGFQQGALQRVVQHLRAGEVPGLHAFIVVRFGYVAAEEYFGGASAEQLHTLQSVSKSVTSLLMGIALDKHLLAGLDAPVLGFFPEYTDIQNLDARKRTLSLANLMSMRTGMSFWEEPYEGSPLQELNSSRGDWLQLVLNRPMTGDPGQTWKYNSGGVIVLGGVLHAASGMAADEFARRHLFAPLGITSSYWYAGNPNGLPHMGGGLNLRPRDLARIGYLVLRRGQWNGAQVVSSDWLDASTRRVTTNTERYFPRATDYGLLWWLFPRNGNTGNESGDDYVVAGSGTGGQWLFIDRMNDLVVVFNGDVKSGSWPAVQLLFSEILPAAGPRPAS